MSSDDARVHLKADKSHVSAYVEYLRSTGRSHDDALLSQEDYDRHRQLSLPNGEMTRRKKLTEEEEMAVYEKRYQERRRMEAAQRRGKGKDNGPARVAGVMAGGIPLAVQHMYMQMAVETGEGDGCHDGFVLPWERHGSHARALPGGERKPLAAAAQGASTTRQGQGQGRGRGRGRGRGGSGSTDKAVSHTSAATLLSGRRPSEGDASRKVAHVPARAINQPDTRSGSSRGRGQARARPASQRSREQEQTEQPRWR